MAYKENANTEKKTQTFIESVVFQSGFTIESDAAFNVGDGTGNAASTTNSHLKVWNGINFPDPDFTFYFANGNASTAGASFIIGGATNTASGATGAFAQGNNAKALGSYGSFAQGNAATASGNYGSFAQGGFTLGYSTVAIGSYGSFSQGHITTASGNIGSFAQGKGNYSTGDPTIASGSYGSFAQGYLATASGANGSFAQGNNIIASGTNGSFAQGNNATANGNNGSFAQGNAVTASGSNGCFAMGSASTSSAAGAFAFGAGAKSTAIGAIQFGTGTNSETNTLSMTTGIRIGGTAAPSSPRNGDIWVASNQVKVRTDGLTKGIVGINKLAEFRAQNNEAPASNPATLTTRNGHWVLSFDADTDESAIFSSVMPECYFGGNLYVDIYWAAESATTGDVIWNAAFESLASQDMDSDGFAAAQAASAATTNATSGVLTKTTITFTQAQADAVAAADGYRLQITRDANNGSDTMTGDAQVKFVQVRGE